MYIGAASAWYFKQFEECVRDTVRAVMMLPPVRSALSHGCHLPVFHSDYLFPYSLPSVEEILVRQMTVEAEKEKARIKAKREVEMGVGQQKDKGSNQPRDQGQGQGGPMGGAEGSVVSGNGVGGGVGRGIEGGIGGEGSVDRSTSEVELRSNETPTGPSEVTLLDTVSRIYYPSN